MLPTQFPVFSPRVIEQAKALLEEKRQFRYRSEPLADGVLQISASYYDHFNFVDHAKVTIDAKRQRVLSAACDCPASRGSAGFCAHCAALLRTVFAEGPAGQISIDAWEAPPSEPALKAEAPAADARSRRTIGDFTYKFCNSAGDLYPFTKDPEIPLERFEMIFGKNERARSLYAWHGKWGGSCFGIAATSEMFNFDGNDVFAADFNADASRPYDLALSDMHRELNIRLHTFIEAVHLIQFDLKTLAEEEKVRSMPLGDRLKLLCERVDAFDKTGDQPVLMDVFGEIGGHAVLPFKLEKTDQTGCRLHIYDPNWPNQVRYCDLTTDARGHYLSWRFPMFGDTVFSSDTGEDITLTRNEDIQAVWENRASVSSDGIAMFAAPRSNVAVRNEGGDVIRIENGKTVAAAEGVIPIRPRFLGPAASPVHSFYLPAGVYRIEALAPEETLCFQISEIERSLEVETEARSVEICLCDAEGVVEAAIPEPEKRFSICLNDPEKRTVLQGVTSEPIARATLKRGALRLYGLDAGRIFSLRINNEDAAVRSFIAGQAPEAVHDTDADKKPIAERNAKKPDEAADH